jgi:hypothetical protein
MALTNTLAYYATATFTTVKSFIVQPLAMLPSYNCLSLSQVTQPFSPNKKKLFLQVDEAAS